MAFFHDDGRWLRDPPEHPDGGRFEVYKVVSTDGGLTWSQPEIIAKHPLAHLCEPGVLRSPDGRQIAVLLRENSRQLNSFVIFSDDEGKTWSEPRELPGALTGDRHTAKYAPDGRLFISFRDRTHISPTKGDWVGWVGTYDDIVAGREGEYRVRLMDNHKGADTAYPGVELLPDGTFVVTTYGHWAAAEEPYIVSVRFKIEELDARAKSASYEPTSMVRAAARATLAPPATADKPNVLFIAVDDLNDWVLQSRSPLKMPNLRRLARRGGLVRTRLHRIPGLQPVPRRCADRSQPLHHGRVRQSLGLATGPAQRCHAAAVLHEPRIPGRGRGQDLPPPRQQRLSRRRIISPLPEDAA